MYLESMYMLSLNVIFSYNYIIAFFVESILHVKYILRKPYLDEADFCTAKKIHWWIFNCHVPTPQEDMALSM